MESLHSNITPAGYHNPEIAPEAVLYLQMMGVELPKDMAAPNVKPPAAKQDSPQVKATAHAAKQLGNVPTTAAGGRGVATLEPTIVQGEALGEHLSDLQLISFMNPSPTTHAGPVVDCMNGFGELHANISQKISEIKGFLNNPEVPPNLRKACVQTLAQLVRVREEIMPGYKEQKSVLKEFFRGNENKLLTREQASELNLREMDEYYNRLSDRFATAKTPQEQQEIDKKRYELRGLYREKYTAQAKEETAKECSHIFREGGAYRQLTHSVAELSKMLLSEDMSQVKIPGKAAFSTGIANFGTNTIRALTESKIAKNLPVDAQAQRNDISSFIAYHKEQFAGL